MATIGFPARARPAPVPRSDGPAAKLAKSRLAVGVACVGTVVSLTAVALLVDLPGQLQGFAGVGFTGDLVAVGLFLAAFAVISAPFDLVGRKLVPQAGVPVPPLTTWFRAVVVQWSLYMVFGGLLLAGGKLGGTPGGLIVFVALTVALVHFQTRVAALIAGFRRASPLTEGAGSACGRSSVSWCYRR